MLEVLLADDDPDVRQAVGEALTGRGHRVTEAFDGAHAVDLLSVHVFDLAICDVRMPRLDGLTLLRRIRREAPRTSVVMMTSFAAISDAVSSLRDGAVDYVAKPFDVDEFIASVVDPIEERRSVEKRFEEARSGAVARSTGTALVTRSAAMKRLADRVAMLGHSDAPVLVSGEEGTGKDLVARTLHAQGPRRDGPLVFVEGSLLPEIMEASAQHDLCLERPPRDAWFRAASEGTLVIDAVDRLPSRAQAQLLRVLDEPATRARRGASWEPLGVRVVSLTRADLVHEVVAGEFLGALYYRLSGVHLHVPTLRQRQEDLCLLVAEILGELAPPNTTLPAVSPRAWNAIERHHYSANVRELRWALEQALAQSDGSVIDLPHLPTTFHGAA